MRIGPFDATEIKIFWTIGSAPMADPGFPLGGLSPSPFPLPLEVGSPLNQLEGLGKHCKVP